MCGTWNRTHCWKQNTIILPQPNGWKFNQGPNITVIDRSGRTFLFQIVFMLILFFFLRTHFTKYSFQQIYFINIASRILERQAANLLLENFNFSLVGWSECTPRALLLFLCSFIFIQMFSRVTVTMMMTIMATVEVPLLPTIIMESSE